MSMTFSSPTTDQDQCRERAILDTLVFIRDHTLSMYEILELGHGPDGPDPLLNLVEICAAAFPDPQAVATALAALQTAISSISFQNIEETNHGARGNRNPHAAVAWHGARLSDLSGRLQTG